MSSASDDGRWLGLGAALAAAAAGAMMGWEAAGSRVRTGISTPRFEFFLPMGYDQIVLVVDRKLNRLVELTWDVRPFPTKIQKVLKRTDWISPVKFDKDLGPDTVDFVKPSTEQNSGRYILIGEFVGVNELEKRTRELLYDWPRLKAAIDHLEKGTKGSPIRTGFAVDPLFEARQRVLVFASNGENDPLGDSAFILIDPATKHVRRVVREMLAGGRSSFRFGGKTMRLVNLEEVGSEKSPNGKDVPVFAVTVTSRHKDQKEGFEMEFSMRAPVYRLVDAEGFFLDYASKRGGEFEMKKIHRGVDRFLSMLALLKAKANAKN
jgi:hypothetical protein